MAVKEPTTAEMTAKAVELLPKYGGMAQFAANQAWLLAGCPASPTVPELTALVEAQTAEGESDA